MVICWLHFYLARIFRLLLAYLQLPKIISPTVIASILKVNIYVRLNFITAYRLDSNAQITPIFVTVSILVHDAIDKVSSTSVSSLVTDTVYILANDALENIDSILASTLVTDALSILTNDSIDKVSLNLASSIVTDAASILTNDSIENIDLTLVYRLENNSIAHSRLLTPSLFTFLRMSLTFSFNCVTGYSSI